MDLDKDYIEYVGQSSLALLAISAAYFFTPSNPVTFLTLVPITVLFGYTAYISRDGFTPASLLSAVTLIFIPVGLVLGMIAVIIPVSNTLISLFAGGKGFGNYSNATLMPMIFTGLILGSIAFGAAQTQPEIKQSIVGSISDVSEAQTQLVIGQTDLKQIQQDAGQQIITQTSQSTILLTKSYLFNQTEMDTDQKSEINQVLLDAEQEIPEQLAERSAENTESIDISDRVGDATENLISANIGIVILMISMTFYIINPLISILTGINGFIFQKIAENF